MPVAAGVSVAVVVEIAVAVGVGEGVSEGVGEGVSEGVGEGVGESVSEGVGEGVGVGSPCPVHAAARISTSVRRNSSWLVMALRGFPILTFSTGGERLHPKPQQTIWVSRQVGTKAMPSHQLYLFMAAFRPCSAI